MQSSIKVGPLKGVTVDMDTQVKDYLKAIGWNTETGVPTKETLESLGRRAAGSKFERIHRALDSVTQTGNPGPLLGLWQDTLRLHCFRIRFLLS